MPLFAPATSLSSACAAMASSASSEPLALPSISLRGQSAEACSSSGDLRLKGVTRGARLRAAALAARAGSQESEVVNTSPLCCEPIASCRAAASSCPCPTLPAARQDRCRWDWPRVCTCCRCRPEAPHSPRQLRRYSLPGAAPVLTPSRRAQRGGFFVRYGIGRFLRYIWRRRSLEFATPR